MKREFEKFVLSWVAGALLIGAGCVGPHYAKHQIIVSGKEAPEIHGPHDPAIAQHLSRHAWPKSPFVDRAAELGVTPFKAMGVQGWKDYHLHAAARGHVVQHEVSANGFRTVDLRLKTLTVDNVPVHWRGVRFMRVEIFLGKVSVDPAILDDMNRILCVEGKLVWDEDGWFEIHPQQSRDVHQEPRPWWHWWHR